jgi:hypothetical protein
MTTKTDPVYTDLNQMMRTVENSSKELSAVVAIKATAKLWDHFLGGEQPPIDVTSGNRYTWMREGTLYVNPEGGWGRMIHDLSHYFHRTLYRRSMREDAPLGLYDAKAARPHSPQHAKLERRMAEYVIRKGWIDGALEPKKAADSVIHEAISEAASDEVHVELHLQARQKLYAEKLAAIKVKIERWEKKAKRAKNALAKLNRSRGYYERALGA